ncbi:probable nuclear hormone receptor HR3 isoform X1 [Phymastichus coffea]|uniref:probable nuclear hormone receptor HR3 isoform X1 n=1 Tax=Phymastichus coffea TaxID=108790 RepID=UPI00273AB72E|nr:probable nuclear hormone receptor HR3 isoform X1 [Phymastichus coffea]
MSRDAVKFGRMSKKQREKVEDEVRFHRAQMRAASETAPDSSVFEHQTPSSSDQHHSYNGGYAYGSNEYASPGPGTGSSTYYNAAMTNYELSADYVDSTTAYDPRPTPTQVDQVAADTVSVNAQGMLPNMVGTGTGAAGDAGSTPTAAAAGATAGSGARPTAQSAAAVAASGGGIVAVKQEAQLELAALGHGSYTIVDSTTFLPQAQQQSHAAAAQPQQDDDDPLPSSESVSEVMVRLVAEAHAKTSPMQPEQIQELFRRGQSQDIARVVAYKSMSHEQLWLECAERLTTMIQGIIEFAKMVPGFMKLSQDDQIVLLKSSSFELAVIRMSKYIDLSTGNVLFAEDGLMLPQDAFYTQDTAEMKLVTCVFELAKSIAELKLSETQLGLYSSLILLSHDRPGLKGVTDVRRTYDLVLRSLKGELERMHMMPLKGDVTVFDALIAKISQLRDVSHMHMEALAKFKRSQTHLEFPALHKELFNLDS